MKTVQYQFCLFLLETAFLTQLNAHVYVFYVKPTFPTNASCHYPNTAEIPIWQCQDIDFYLRPGFLRGAGHITLMLFKGVHKSSGLHWEPGVRQFVYFLRLLGSSPAKETVMESIHPIFKDMKDIYFENITVNASVIEVRQQNAIPHSTNFTFNNCIFRGTTIQMERVTLLVSNTSFYSSPSTALYLYSSTLTLSGDIAFANNRGAKGGALALIGSALKLDGNVSVLFENNSADEVGGAIYINLLKQTDPRYIANCFYEVINYGSRYSKNYTLNFNQNSAVQSGDHVYGYGMKGLCVALYDHNDRPVEAKYLDNFVLFNVYLNPDNVTSLSAISSDPSRVCMCDYSGQPECTAIAKIFSNTLEVYPGETFTIPAAIVGDDFGISFGTVYADIYTSNNDGASVSIKPPSQGMDFYKKCANLTYTILSNDTAEIILYLTVSPVDLNTADDYYRSYSEIENKCDEYKQTGFIDPYMLSIPVFFNVTLLDCPPGFTLQGEDFGCGCHPVLVQNGATCKLERKKGYIGWNTDMWLSAGENINSTVIHISKNCPPNYCTNGSKLVSLQDHDTQCFQHRTGVLCGGCKENFSLAIGSFNCIHCTTNNNLALLIFFAAAGPLLVIIIGALNLTVTQGMVNGLVVYANLIWAYQSIFFPQKISGFLLFLRVFIAWINLDFGVEVCFFKGLNAFWKTWLQYVFPLYTAGLFFICLRYSSKLSKLCGSRSVPTLATLLFLSYSKLLRTIIASLRLASISIYTGSNAENSFTSTVWALDGNLSYGHYPHAFLLLAALVCLALLWTPYTVFLFTMQWLRRIDHYRPLRMIAKYKPVYDAYFGPLRDKHHYWFGVLLLVQGILLLTSSLTLNIVPFFNMFLLFIVVIILFGYLNYMRTYKKKSVIVLESMFFLNLALLLGGTMYFKQDNYAKNILVQTSIAFAFVEFLVTILVSAILNPCLSWLSTKRHTDYNNIDTVEERAPQEPETHLPALSSMYAHYRDSILESEVRMDTT